MIRLIDANVLKDEIVKEFEHGGILLRGHGPIKCLNDILVLVDKSSTIHLDVTKHGYWEKHCDTFVDCTWYSCSECESSPGSRTPYCEECGAKMDSEG